MEPTQHLPSTSAANAAPSSSALHASSPHNIAIDNTRATRLSLADLVKCRQRSRTRPGLGQPRAKPVRRAAKKKATATTNMIMKPFKKEYQNFHSCSCNKKFAQKSSLNAHKGTCKVAAMLKTMMAPADRGGKGRSCQHEISKIWTGEIHECEYDCGVEGSKHTVEKHEMHCAQSPRNRSIAAGGECMLVLGGDGLHYTLDDDRMEFDGGGGYNPWINEKAAELQAIDVDVRTPTAASAIDYAIDTFVGTALLCIPDIAVAGPAPAGGHAHGAIEFEGECEACVDSGVVVAPWMVEMFEHSEAIAIAIATPAPTPPTRTQTALIASPLPPPPSLSLLPPQPPLQSQPTCTARTTTSCSAEAEGSPPPPPWAFQPVPTDASVAPTESASACSSPQHPTVNVVAEATTPYDSSSSSSCTTEVWRDSLFKTPPPAPYPSYVAMVDEPGALDDYIMPTTATGMLMYYDRASAFNAMCMQ
eukprot:gene16616-10491_t